MLQTQNQCNGPQRNGLLFLEIQLIFKRFRYSAFYKFSKHVVERKALRVDMYNIQYTLNILVEIDHSRSRAVKPSSINCAIVALSRKPSSSWLTQKFFTNISCWKALQQRRPAALLPETIFTDKHQHKISYNIHPTYCCHLILGGGQRSFHQTS